MSITAGTPSAALAELDRAAAAARDSAIVIWRGAPLPLASVPGEIAAMPNRGERDRLFSAYREGLAAMNHTLERRIAAILEAGDPAAAVSAEGLEPRALGTELELFILESETPYFAALRRNLALIGIEQGDATEGDLWHVNRGAAWSQWFSQRAMLKAVAATGRPLGGIGGEGWLAAKAMLAGSVSRDSRIPGRAIAATYANLVGSPAWLESELGMAVGEIAAFADFAAFVSLWRLRHDAALVQYEVRLIAARGEPDLAREYYAGLLGTVTGVEVAEEGYLSEVVEPFESARAVGAALLAGALGETLEARHGAAWWREAEAVRLIGEIGSSATLADALARLGYDALDWRPVMRQIRTRLIGEMSGYGGPNITTRAGTRKV